MEIIPYLLKMFIIFIGLLTVMFVGMHIHTYIDYAKTSPSSFSRKYWKTELIWEIVISFALGAFVATPFVVALWFYDSL